MKKWKKIIVILNESDSFYFDFCHFLSSLFLQYLNWLFFYNLFWIFFTFFLIKYPKLKIKEIQNNRIYCNTNNFLNNQNLTILDLGKCEDELKEKYTVKWFLILF